MNNRLAFQILGGILCFSILLNYLLLFGFFTSSNIEERRVNSREATNAPEKENCNQESKTIGKPIGVQPSISPQPSLIEEKTIKPTNVKPSESVHVQITPPRTGTRNSTMRKPKPSFGNIANDEVFQQSKERRRTPLEKGRIIEIPTFSTIKINDGMENYVSLNRKLVPISKKYDIIFLIPTLARINQDTGVHATYLLEVLEEYENQLKDVPKDKSVLFIIHAFINEKTHKVFNKAAKRFKHVVEFVFFVPPFRFRDPYSDIPLVEYSSPLNPYPGKLARQQTCDVLMMTRFVMDNFSFKYLLYTEDDFLPCHNMLITILDTLDGIERYHSNAQFPFEKGFCAMRITIGLGGFVVTRHYASRFLEYAKNNIEFEPIDILIQFISFKNGDGYKTCLADGLTHYSMGRSFLQHIGYESNWKERNDKKIFKGRDIQCNADLGIHLWDLGQHYGTKVELRNCSNMAIKPCI